jgi:hypothetical protein
MYDTDMADCFRSPREAEVVKLKFFAGLSEREAAEVPGVSNARWNADGLKRKRGSSSAWSAAKTESGARDMRSGFVSNRCGSVGFRRENS